MAVSLIPAIPGSERFQTKRAQTRVTKNTSNQNWSVFERSAGSREENASIKNGTVSGIGDHDRQNIERFRAKWIPVRVKKTRLNNNPELRF
jgi:hypothetical protein